MIHGLATASGDYTSAGEVINVAAYIKSASTNATFRLLVGGDQGYVAEHNRGTSNAGVLNFYEAGADAAALDEVADNTNLYNVIVPFIAIGPAY